MLRTACVFGKVSISNNAMTLQLQNMTGAAGSSESSTANSPMSPPTTNSLLQMVESGEITAHVSKQDLTQKQLASQLNYLQRLHSLKTGKGGEWSQAVQEQLINVKWFGAPRESRSITSATTPQLALTDGCTADSEPNDATEAHCTADASYIAENEPNDATEPDCAAENEPNDATKPTSYRASLVSLRLSRLRPVQR